jgi:hypothetical protein
LLAFDSLKEPVELFQGEVDALGHNVVTPYEGS